MKKAIFIAITFCSIYSANSQVITTVPKGPLPKIPRSVIVNQPSVVVNRTTGNYPDSLMRVGVSIEDAGEQGYKVNFHSSIPLERVEIMRSQPAQVMNTLYFGDDKTSGYFFMDSGAYKGSKTYILRFYAPGLPKAMWSTAIQR
ncbi:MAG: hypothetical protein ABIO05_05445 [Ferruginibacter sp.]